MARQPAQPSRLPVPEQPARRWSGLWRRLGGGARRGGGVGGSAGVSIGAGRADGRGQVRGGGGAGELGDRARRLEVSEGRRPGRGAGAERASPLPTCAGLGAAHVEVARLGSSPHTQGDLG